MMVRHSKIQGAIDVAGWMLRELPVIPSLQQECKIISTDAEKETLQM